MRRIEQLEEAWRAGRLVEATRGEEGRLAMFTLAEATEFLAVPRAFAQSHPAELPDRIKEALDGPADLHNESQRSNRGRNVMFELNLASHLKLQGLPIDELPVNPDILTRLGEVQLYFQCKRPLKPETIPDNIHNAEKQLIRDLDAAGDPNIRGIVAVSVSRVFNPGSQFFVGPELNGLKESLGEEVRRVGEAHRRTFTAILDPRIIAILFHLITPAFVENIALLTIAQNMFVFRLPGRPQADNDLLRTLEGILNTD
jgi:hypothetical protein